MAKTKAFRRRRWNLWNANPCCVYCGIATIPPEWFNMMEPEQRRRFQDWVATIDHLRPRHHPGRLEPAFYGEQRLVLSCWKCNNDRDKRELAEVPKQWFYERGCGTPLSMKSSEELLKIEARLLSAKPTHAASRKRIAKSLAAVREAIQGNSSAA